MEPKDKFKIISQTCDKGKHKLRENKFGVVWCVRCGMLSNTMNAPKLEETDKLKF